MKRSDYRGFLRRSVMAGVLLAGAAWFGCGSERHDQDVVAKVGNTVLTRDALKAHMAFEGLAPEREVEYIDLWVNRELLYQEAKRAGIQKSEAMRWNLENVEKQLFVTQLMEKTFAEKIQISDTEARDFYEKNKTIFVVPEDAVHLLDILTHSQAEAEAVVQEIRAGKPFDQAAREKSTGLSKETAGDMGFLSRSDLGPDLARTAFILGEGSVSGPVRAGEGFHVLKVVKKRSKGAILDFDEVRADVMQRLRVNKERSVYYDFLHELKAKQNVQVTAGRTNEGAEPVGNK
jgi:peptidyl-prolyl cis-trans isomerase C